MDHEIVPANWGQQPRTPVSFVRHKVKQSYSSRMVCPRINKFYSDIHTDLLYISTVYDVTIYFRSEVIAIQIVENADSYGCGRNFSRMLCARITKFYVGYLSQTIGHRNGPDMTSLTASGRL